MLIAILLSFCASTAFAQNNWNWGENFSWSVECDSATVSANGPDDDCWVYNDNEKDENGNPLTPFLGVIVNLEQLQKVEEAYLEWDDENGNIGRDTLSVYTKNGGEDCCVKVFNSWKPVYGYDEIVNVPCVLLHRNCKNILKIKVRTVTVPPTIIHFVADDASEINKHPFYGDCNWTSLLPPIIVKCHRHCYDVYDHYDWDEFDTYFYYTSYEYDKYVVEDGPIFPNTFCEEIDWGYKSCYSYGHNDSPVDYISFHIDEDGGWDSQDISFNPSSIYEQGEYVVNVTYNFTEGSRLTPGACWGTNFQFDLDGGGSVDYTIEPGEKHFSISGKGIMGEYHTADEAVGFHLKIIPNPIKVLESVTVLYDSGVSDEIEEISVPFIFNEEGGYYELGELEDHVFDGALWIDGGWMNTIVVRFKDDDRIIEFADSTIKQICVDNWDTNGDDEISRCEAAAVTNIGTVFSQNKTIKSFDELKYFSSLENLPDNTFLYCTSLTSITLPSSIHGIGKNALSGCTSMTRIDVADGNTDFKSVDGVLFSLDGKQLIQYPAAKGTTYRVPEGTESVARDAFFMSNLSGITLPSTIKSLDFDAFGYSTNLEKIAMPEGLETISDYVFDHCTGMKEVVIPSTVTTIGQHVFQSCKAIESVYSYIKSPFAIAENNFDKSVYDNAVLFVPKAATDDYSSLDGWRNFKHRGISDIVFADSKVKSLCVGSWDLDSDGELSFYEAGLVTSIGSVFKENKTIASFDELRYFTGLKSISASAFLNCTSLESVTIPANVETVGTKALSGCSSMTRIDVAEGSCSFLSNDGVLFTANGARLVQYPAAKGSTFSVPSGTVIIGQDAFYISKLSSVLLPNTLRTIESGAFAYSKSLSSIELPEGLTSIGNNAFEYCSGVYNITIPSTLTYMGQQIFNACNNIRSVHSHIETPSDMAENNFTASVYANAVLYVPENSLDLYGTAKGWRNFAKIVGDPGEVVPEYTVTIPDVTIAQGGTAKMVIELNNGEAVVNGYQFEVEFPAGVELQTDKDGGYIYELPDRYSVKDGMQISINKVSSQVYRVMASSMTNVTLTGTDGPVLMLSLAASDEIADSGTGIVRNIVISTNEGVSITTDDVEFAVIKAEYAMGDANGDGSVNVTDVMLIVNHILGNTLPVFHEECANMNGDSRIDVADVMLLVNMILSGESQAPVAAQFETSGLEVVSTSGNNVDIRMNNISEYTAFQMQVQMPSDVRLIGVELAEETTGHRVLTKEIGDGLYNVIVYSLNGENFKETFDGNLLRLVTDGRAKGIEMRNIQFTNQYFETVTFSDVTETTGIEDVSSDETDGFYYNLQGIPVKNPSQGVFIHDNKAILVK